MKKLFEKIWFVPAVTTVLLGLMFYGTYALYYEFSGAAEGVAGIPYSFIASVACAWFFFVFAKSVFKEKLRIPAGILSAVLGAGFFQGVLWSVNAAVNTPDGLLNERVVLTTQIIAYSVVALLLLATFILRAKNKNKVMNIILAVVYFFASCVALYFSGEEDINRMKYLKNISFDSISADEMAVTSAEKQRCRDWYDSNILLKNGKTELPYDFKVDGKSINDDSDNWTYEVSPESENGAVYQGGKTSYITLKNKNNSLVATVEATIYEENATCEWTVFIRNDGSENSGVISDFYAFDDTVDTGKAELYYSTGSHDHASDFSMMKKNLSVIPSVFTSEDGRPTDLYLSYFNVSGENFGIMLGVGWTGLWETAIKQSGDDAHIKVKQENFEAYLLPSEEVRSPLVSLTFYENDNALKGFNMFRKWVMDCVYPENITDTITMLEIAGPHSVDSAAHIIETMNTFPEEVFENADNLWMDAGWYYKQANDWSSGVGSWIPDAERFPNGISELSEYARSKNCGLVVWYEPERAMNGSEMYNIGSEHEQWLVPSDDYAMWNLANEDALKYFCEYMADSLNKNGVTVYRQDFNFSPDVLWKKADKEFYDGRTGICENHYVTNLYVFLDYLCENVEGLIIDNCASGGRRLDLEMTRRSVPIWRSDYNCAFHVDLYEATQSQTYGLSFWLPLSGTLKYTGSEYESRSSILTCHLDTFGTIFSEHAVDYTEQRELMTENYYPLEHGSYNDRHILAMQYSSADGIKGEAFIYKRDKVNDTEYTLRLNGLIPDKEYEVYDIDSPEYVHEFTGEQLMTEGVTIPLPIGEKAIIIMFSAI